MGYVVGGCNVQCSCYTEHGRYGLSCLYAETVECMSVYGMYVMYGIWSIAAEHGRYIWIVFYVEDSGVSSCNC